MATRVGLAKIWMTPFDRPTPKTPSLVQNSETYLKCELSYGKFCVEISKIFVSMATGVSLTQISVTRLNWRTMKTPYLVQEYWWYRLYKLSNGWFCVQMTSACCHGNKGGSNGNLNNTIWLPDPENPQFVANILHVSLTVPELWLFEVAIGRNAKFQILGLRGVNFNFY